VRWTIAGLLLACAGAPPAEAREVIRRFHSHIVVREDGSMEVQETIAVRAEGDQIRRGIYRDFPTQYQDRLGHDYVVGFELQQVLRDGFAEPHHTAPQENGIRIYIGDADVFLPTGEYTYMLTYTTTRQLGFFEDHDELYWNVTGTGWSFPIEEASATVVLPGQVEASALRLDGYTGPQGAAGRDYTATAQPDGTIWFSSTRPLNAYEGLTIVAGFPKGIVRPPTQAEQAEYFVHDNRSILVGLIGLLGLLAYYFWVWHVVGRDPARGTIVVQYEPPERCSPATLRYISRMGFDNEAFSAAVINLAVKGAVTIKEEKKLLQGTTYTLTKRNDDVKGLAPEEQKILSALLGGRVALELDNTHYAKLQAATQAATRALSVAFEKRYFATNRGYVFFGLALSVGASILIGFSHSVMGGTMVTFMAVWLAGWSVGVGFLLSTVFASWKRALSSSGIAMAGGTAAAVGISVFAIPFVIGEVMGLVFLTFATSLSDAFIMGLMVAVNALFFHLMKAYTLTGRKFMDHVEGFKTFLAATEQDRLNVLNPPEKTPELFERYLPYALALGVEQQWSEQFTTVLARAAQGGGDAGYVPVWYSGPSWRAGSPGHFASSFCGSLSSAIASSSTPPGSSSGGGGGGSSGGGGGGGGGGGW
jgi:hypothetical protein